MTGKKIIAGCSSQIANLKEFLQEGYDSGFKIVLFGEDAPDLMNGLNIHGRSGHGDIQYIDPAQVCEYFAACSASDIVAVTVSFDPHGPREMQDYMSKLLGVLRQSQGEMHVFLAEMQDFADFLHAYEAGDIVLMAQIKQRTNPVLNKLLATYPLTFCD